MPVSSFHAKFHRASHRAQSQRRNSATSFTSVCKLLLAYVHGGLLASLCGRTKGHVAHVRMNEHSADELDDGDWMFGDGDGVGDGLDIDGGEHNEWSVWLRMVVVWR